MKANSISNLINDTMESVLENTHDFMFVKDKNLVYVGSSMAFAVECAGKSCVDEIIGKTDYEVFDNPVYAEKYRRDDEELLLNGIPKIEYRETYPGTDGEINYCLTTKYLIRDEAGEPAGVFGQCRDITEQVRLEELGEEQQKMLSLNMNILDALRNVYDICMYWNLPDDTYYRVYGKSDGVDELVPDRGTLSETLTLWLAEDFTVANRDKYAEFYNLDTLQQRLTESGAQTMEIETIHSGWIRSSLVPVEFDENRTVTSCLWVGEIIDQEVRKEQAYHKALAEAAHIAETDALTGLLNRGGCEQRLRDVIEQRTAGPCCLMDINEFKHINDRYGHAIGDCVLEKIAESLIKVFRDQDILSRFGGDEFVMFLPGIVDSSKAEMCLKRLVSEVERERRIEIGGEHIRVSIGAFIYDGSESVDLGMFYEKCDSAMYRCKERNDMPYQIVGADDDAPVCGKRVLDLENSEEVFNMVFSPSAQTKLSAEELTMTMKTLLDMNRVNFFIRLRDYSYVVLKETVVVEDNDVPFENPDAREMLAENVKKKALEQYRDNLLEFVNLETLAKRLTDVDCVKFEYQNIQSTWCIASFFVLEREDGAAVKVLYQVAELTRGRAETYELLQMQKEAVSQLSNSELLFISTIDRETGETRLIQSKRVLDASRVFDFDASMIRERTHILSSEQQEFAEKANLARINKELKDKDHYTISTLLQMHEGGRYRRLSYHFANTKKYPQYILSATEDITESFTTDPITGMKNFEGFKMDCLYELQKSELSELMVLNFNIFNFKAINALYGYEAGNWLLRTIISNLEKSEVNFLSVCRENADNFFCLCSKEEFDFEEINKLCKMRIFNESGLSEQMKLFCGIYPITDNSENIEECCDKARLARRYAEREIGVNAYILNEEGQTRYLDEASIISTISEAINREEMVVYYQPIYDARTGKLASAEALVRWKHPEKGILAPELFIPVIERTGQIAEIDICVGRQVHRFQMNRFQAGKHIVPVSINVSRYDFLRDKYMRAAIATISGNPEINSMIRIEITESGLLNIPNKGEEFIREMRKMGIQIMIDDFGTGYSSLASIVKRSYDIIKLDMSLTSAIGIDRKNEILIKATIETAHNLGVKVVAEGVETEPQYEFLRDSGCDFIQGYYFSKPIPESEFAALLERNADTPGLAD